MIEWRDDAIVLAAWPHADDAHVLQLLTRRHGKHAGLLRSSPINRDDPPPQPGSLLDANWRARQPDDLGRVIHIIIDNPSKRLAHDQDRLLALSAAMALCEQILPERSPEPATFHGTLALLDALERAHWAEALVQWEVLLLREIGFALDLRQCARGSHNDPPAYVSPRTGRAVSAAAGQPYSDKLLPLPAFLAGDHGGGVNEAAQGLELTGHFLRRNILHPTNRDLPEPRRRLMAHLQRRAGRTPDATVTADAGPPATDSG